MTPDEVSALVARLREWHGRLGGQAVRVVIWDAIAALTTQAQALTELRDRDRVLSRHLEQRATARDPLAQSLIAENDRLLERCKALEAEIVEQHRATPPDKLNLAGRLQFDRAEAAEQALTALREEARQYRVSRDHYDEERRQAYQREQGWKGRAELAERELTALREERDRLHGAPVHRVTPPRLRGEPTRNAECPTHGDPLVCLACEAEEDARPEWRQALTALREERDGGWNLAINRLVEIDELRQALTAKEAEIAALRELLAQAKPRHYAAECGHCGIDELPPSDCPTLAFIARIDAALTSQREAQK